MVGTTLIGIGAAIIGVTIALAIYFLPAVIASKRKTHNENGIFILNLLTGWTAIGWFVALAMACGSQTKTKK